MKKYYSLILFVVFVLVAGAILLFQSGKNERSINNQAPIVSEDANVDSEFSTENLGSEIDSNDENDEVVSDPEYADLENVSVDFEQDVIETEDILEDYSNLDGEIDADSIDDDLL
ncbi:MAG TPA: hypothetical protein DD451_00580 [Candidatus Moranbacteria bacterium]|nr:hypothetical protein [Candidatus Moranbacteria bacterium]